MTGLVLLLALLLIGLGIACFVVGFFRKPEDAAYDAAFQVNIDNLNRNTLFDIPELQPALWPLMQIARRIGVEGIRRRVLRNLLASGNPSSYSPDEYLTLCLLAGVALGAISAFMQSVIMNTSISPLTALVGFVLGFWTWEILLHMKAQNRIRRVNIHLPYVLDLLSMTMQAGATFYEAAKTVAEENPDEPLNQELGMVVREIEFGRSRQEALQHLADRLPLDSLTSVIGTILQAEQLGVPLSDVLVAQANLMRMHRSMRAEKALGEAVVKLLIPSMLIFISVILVIFGPMIVRALRGELMGT